MPFNSFSYPAFLLCTVLLFWVAPARLRTLLLILSGILYYASHDVRSFFLILVLAALTFASGKLLEREGSLRKTYMVLSIVLLVLVLVFFKYLGLLAGTFTSVTGASLSVPSIALPLGISFFTFEFIHYIADRYQRKILPHRARDFFAFAFFFPTLVSGPIKRFEQFHASIHDLRWRSDMLYSGILFLLLGYGQKYLFADPLIPFTTILAHPEALLTPFSAAGGLILYSFRIYFDFAGLSNIAIGSAMLFGILVPQNFNAPYLSSDIQIFWRRWHMSLSSWVRDYVYILLGGSRKGVLMTAVNLLIVMTIVGIWHGASWNFAVWGIWHGCGLILHRLWRASGLTLGQSLPARILGILCTFAFVTVGWAFFVTSSLADSWLLLQKASPFL